MNHRDAGIFEAKINERIRSHVQAAFLEKPSADGIIRATSHPPEPVELTESEINSLTTHLIIVKYRQPRDSLSETFRATFGTIKKGKSRSYMRCTRKLKINLRVQRPAYEDQHSKSRDNNFLTPLTLNKQMNSSTSRCLTLTDRTGSPR